MKGKLSKSHHNHDIIYLYPEGQITKIKDGVITVTNTNSSNIKQISRESRPNNFANTDAGLLLPNGTEKIVCIDSLKKTVKLL